METTVCTCDPGAAHGQNQCKPRKALWDAWDNQINREGHDADATVKAKAEYVDHMREAGFKAFQKQN